MYIASMMVHGWLRISTQHKNFFYECDSLWDGAGCGPLNTCCTFNNPPWFYKELPEPTTDDIEMRVCKEVPMKLSPLHGLITLNRLFLC